MRIGSDSPEGAVVRGTAAMLCTESASRDGDIVGSEEVSRLERRSSLECDSLVGSSLVTNLP